MSHYDILLVEDNPDDVELTRLAFAEVGGAHRLQAVSDGAEALDYLLARGRHAGRDGTDLPALVLLDLNLPRLDGRDVLKALRADPATQRLPIVVLTTSAEPDDVDQAYTLGANSFIQKPVEYERFVEVVRQIGRYWLTINLPPGRD